MPMYHATRCDCGNQCIRIIKDWESYDTPYRIPPGWRYGTRSPDPPSRPTANGGPRSYRVHGPICPECQKKEVVS